MMTSSIHSIVAACLIAAPVAAAEPAAPENVFQDRTADLELAPGNGAACWFDFDGDGWVDLCTGGGVWKNEGGRRFVRVADAGTGVAADFDNDGHVDLFSWSDLRLFRNVGGTGLEEVKLPEHPACSSRGACWADLNGDGLVDLYIGGYEGGPTGIFPDLVLLNRGAAGFEHTWSDARHCARGVTAADFDRDGDPDVYVSNYRLQPNVLWLNDGAGVLADATAAHNAIATSGGFGGGHAIGAAWGDFDDDGHIDLFAGNFAHVDGRGDQPKSRFLRNQGPEAEHVFDDRGTCGVFYQESYASPAAGDYDNDGDVDLYFTTVYGTASFGRANHPVLFRNDGDFSFADGTAAAGLAGLPPTYQAAWADFDNDGDLDLISGGKLYVNQGNPRHWLKVRLEGDGKAVNRAAIGAQVRVRLQDRTLTRHVEAGTGEGNQNDLTLHFGLGDHAGPVALEVFWPGGHTHSLADVAIDAVTVIRYDGAPQGNAP